MDRKVRFFYKGKRVSEEKAKELFISYPRQSIRQIDGTRKLLPEDTFENWVNDSIRIFEMVGIKKHLRQSESLLLRVCER